MKRSQPRARIRIRAQDPVLRARIAERLEDLGDLVLESDGTSGSGVGGASRADVSVQPPVEVEPVAAAEGAADAGADAAADAATGGRGETTVTPREAEVLALLADGLANKEIGARLSISAHTAKFHVESLLRKLDAVNRAEAVREGIRRGLIGL